LNKTQFRILHVNDVANVGSNLVTGLNELGIEAALMPIAKIATQSKRSGGVLTLPIKKLQNSFQIRSRVRSDGFNIVHIHFATQALLALIVNIPYYLHIHGTDVRRYLYIAGFRQLIIYLIKNAIKVFYVTPDLEQHLVSFRPDAIFLPNPINVDMFQPVPETEERKYQVLCISKLDRYKGLEQFIHAIELVWKDRPNVTIAMFGFGNLSAHARQFLEQNKDNPNLEIIPRIPYTQMPSLINSSEIILGHQSSEYGSLSCSELEAMACEKSVIVNFNFTNAYNEVPPVFLSNSAEEARDVILQLLDDPEKAKAQGKLARAWVKKYHERQQITQILLDHYQQKI
jgi:glycosyltransferase involved in cell wall biosynthesis